MNFAEKLKARLEKVSIENLVKTADPELAEQRMSICTQCEFYIKLTHQCSKCGCIMNLKTKLKDAECPINKW